MAELERGAVLPVSGTSTGHMAAAGLTEAMKTSPLHGAVRE